MELGNLEIENLSSKIWDIPSPCAERIDGIMSIIETTLEQAVTLLVHRRDPVSIFDMTPSQILGRL